MKRVLDRLDPNCVDIVFHVCWSSPPGDAPTGASDADREAARNFEVGESYFKGKNYKGAESRFREALGYKPNDPEATFKLAVSLEKLGQTEEARDTYEAYLKIQPRGPWTERAKKALQRLEAKGRH